MKYMARIATCMLYGLICMIPAVTLMDTPIYADGQVAVVDANAGYYDSDGQPTPELLNAIGQSSEAAWLDWSQKHQSEPAQIAAVDNVIIKQQLTTLPLPTPARSSGAVVMRTVKVVPVISRSRSVAKSVGKHHRARATSKCVGGVCRR